jgi:hypothetical protein
MRVVRLSIAPVRSLGLRHPPEIHLTEAGVLEDRRFYLIDEVGRLVDRLVVGQLVKVHADIDREATHLRMWFPDGAIVEDEVRLGEPVATPLYGRTAHGHVVLGPWAEALEPIARRRVRLVRTDRPGGTRMAHPATMITNGSLARLARHLSVEAIDARRFRMLIELDGQEPHEEDRWIGNQIAIGEAVLSISGPVARCAITTQDPDSGERDLDTLRAIIEYRGRRDGRYADFGVFGEVERAGRIRVGDRVMVLDDGAGSNGSLARLVRPGAPDARNASQR